MAGPVDNPGKINFVDPKRLVDLANSGIWADFVKKSNEAWTAAGQTNYPRPKGTKGENMSKSFKKYNIRD
ncbi:hypothetical protein LTR70_007742 [Exophiala xenobiotica]|uniref:Uncharacterized protein n=1 Tax=Lithohypha guttulata TaxID=1690604 RepID=A0ABR0K564_9EURO|nr:hypothetical protein LTR24_006699 [Lithohypha guttulata]KAK5313225.1 hypothetical protein LTR70_007742 [Exophiala xenobiotica]